jgi:hypothetical protein
LLGLLLGGCVLEPVDLDGKACPCASGWVCDPDTQTCRAGAVDPASSTGGSSGLAETSTGGNPSSTSADPGTSTTGAIPGRFDVVSFSADWSTPESIHWTWEVEGDEADFHAWEIHVAADEAGLDTSPQVYDGDTNPELGRFVLKNTAGVDPVVASLTRGLEPSTEYVARLFVFDTSGGVSQSSNLAVRRTSDAPTQSLLLFDDEPIPAGSYPLPECLQRSEMAPAEGSHHLSASLWCDAEAGAVCEQPLQPGVECWENLRLESLQLSLDGLGGGDLSDAFLEFSLAIDVPDGVEGHGWWGSAGVRIGEGTREYSPLTYPADGAYHRFQVPLTQMGIGLDELGETLQGPRLGSQWQHGSTLRLDAVYVRW